MNEIKIKNVNEIIYEYQTKEGLSVYIWPYDLSDQVSLSLIVNYGSIHTDFKVNNKEYCVPNGIAHFLEHIKFNVNKDLTAHDIYNKLGSYVNAYTTYDHTAYEVECTTNVEENLINLLSFVYTPYFTKRLIDKEKPIVIEEAKSVLDNPYNKGYFELQKNIYKNSKYKNIITGKPEEIKSINIDDVLNVYNNFYHPKNCFLIVTGNVKPFEIEKIVDNFFIENKFDKYTKPILKKVIEDNKVLKKNAEIETNVSKDKMIIAFKYPLKLFKEYSYIDIYTLINIILTFNIGSSSELKEYLNNNCIIDSLYFSLENSEDSIVIYIEISTDYYKEVEDKIIKQMNNLKLSEEEFNLQKKVLISDCILGYDGSSQVNNNIRMDLLKNGKIIDNLIDIYKGYTIKDINKIIEILKKYSYSKVILKPLKKS